MVILLVLLSISSAFSFEKKYEGVVTVLEAPIFSIPDINAKVIQYARKGEKIKVHPHYFNFVEKELEIVDLGEEPDPLLNNKNPRDFSNEFYLILSKDGQEAYIPKKFVHLSFNDPREFKRRNLKIDPTDYRIKEPLPKNYPLKVKTGYRGGASFAIGNSVASSYSFGEKINSADSSFYKDLNLTWSRKALISSEDYIYYGGMVSISSFSTSSKHNTYKSSESEFNVGIGPRIIYDPIRYTDSFFSLAFSLPIYFVKNLTVQIDTETESNERVYKSFSINPQLDIIYSKSKLIHDLDFTIGVRSQLNLFTNYSLVSDDSTQESVWNDSEFNQERRIQLSYFIGLQTNY